MKFTTRQKLDGSWFADFRMDGRRHRPALPHATTKKSADGLALELIFRMKESPALALASTPNQKPLTLAKCLEDYAEFIETDPEHPRRPQYVALVKTQIKKLIHGTAETGAFKFGENKSVLNITNADITALKKSRAKFLKMGTISHELRLLRAALNHARFQGYRVPELKIKVPQNVTRQRHFSDPEFKRLWDYLNPASQGLPPGGAKYRHWLDAHHLCLALRLTGTRVSECGGIKFSDINWERQCIKVLTAKQKKPDFRDVPMLPVLAEVMKERMETARAYDPVGYKNALVFGAGTALKRHQCRLITRAINILGFNVGEEENLCLHSFRHSFASENLRTGKIPLQTMKELLGHSSINTTMIYAHNIPAESIARVLEIPSPV